MTVTLLPRPNMKDTIVTTIKTLAMLSNCLFMPLVFSIISEIIRYTPPRTIIVPSIAAISSGINESISSTNDCMPRKPIASDAGHIMNAPTNNIGPNVKK